MASFISSFSASDVTIPQEVVDNIIAHLVDEDNDLERIALKSTSLISRAFLAPSQRRICAYTTIDGANTKLERRLQKIEESPHLTSYVRTLFIYGGPRPEEFLKQPLLPRVLERFTHVHTLLLNVNLTWPGLSSEMQSAFRTLFSLPTLSEVSLGSSLTILTESLLTLPSSLSHLRLYSPPQHNQFPKDQTQEGGSGSTSTGNRRPVLTSLTVEPSCPDWVINWASDPDAIPDLSKLEDLNVGIDLRDEKYKRLEILLFHVAGTLRSLELNMPYRIDRYDTTKTLDISMLTNLREIVLDSWLSLDTNLSRQRVQRLASILSTLPHGSLVSLIEIRFFWSRFDDSYFPSNGDEIPWGLLDPVFTQSSLKSLRRVVIKLAPHDYVDAIIKSLPETSSRGLLEVELDVEDSS